MIDNIYTKMPLKLKKNMIQVPVLYVGSSETANIICGSICWGSACMQGTTNLLNQFFHLTCRDCNISAILSIVLLAHWLLKSCVYNKILKTLLSTNIGGNK